MTRKPPRETGRPLTVEEFTRLPEDDAFRVELVRGAVVREPRPSAYHGVLTARLFRALDAHVRAAALGTVLIETGFRLPGHAALVRGPDIAFIGRDRMPREIPKRGFWELAPDLAIEILSPHDRPAALESKALDYLGAGTREVWIVDPSPGHVTIRSPAGERTIVASPAALRGRDVVPGFTLELETLFAD